MANHSVHHRAALSHQILLAFDHYLTLGLGSQRFVELLDVFQLVLLRPILHHQKLAWLKI